MALPLIFLPIFLLLPTFTSGIRPTRLPLFSEAPEYRNNELCATPTHTSSCDPSLIHIAMTLDLAYIRGTIAAVHSILQHSSCPDNIFFHFLAVPNHLHLRLRRLIHSTFPSLRFQVYSFNPSLVSPLISSSVRQALEKPLNYARNHIADILPECVEKVIYLDSDIAVVDDIAKLWKKETLNSSAVISAPVYCHANFTSYFTESFWRDPTMSRTFDNRRKKPCYFNTGVMVMELRKWREGKYGEKIRRWMEVQRKGDPRIYELGSLPPFLLVFGGDVEGLDHRWNQHGLGGDNVVGSCRGLHPGGVSLLHWSGKGKPWVRLDEGRPCPVDFVWKNYDLYFGRSGSSFF